MRVGVCSRLHRPSGAGRAAQSGRARDRPCRGLRRRRAVIQLASSLRNLGRPEELLVLLVAEASAPEDELSAAVSAFLVLALVSVGRERAAVAESL